MAVAACTGITVWGFTDAHSWLNDEHWGQLRGPLPHYPLLFDEDFRAKPMFFGMRDAFLAPPGTAALPSK
jgi:endo-1,4-beta-xylanase